MGKIIVKGITYGGGDCANQNLADEFSESSTYAVDDYVIYQDDLYKCTTAVSTAGSWDNTKWTRAQITDEMGSGSGEVADVYVNGASVLDVNKIAQIKSYKEVTQAEYDALPASKESDDVLYCITDQATADTTVAPIIYSEEEREVGVWTDGKPLYEKTFYYATLNASRNDWAILEAFTLDKFIDVSVSFTDNNDRYLDKAYMRISYYNGNLYYHTPESSGICNNIYVTIQYTKTTDQPGSGKYVPSGVPAVHYSENEQVVGTWVDGSTVYEKTFVISGVVSGIYQINMSGIKDFISYYGYIKDDWSPSSIIPIPRVASDGNNIGIGNVYDDYFTLIIPSAFGSRLYDPIITIRYTKTTS